MRLPLARLPKIPDSVAAHPRGEDNIENMRFENTLRVWRQMKTVAAND